MENNFSNLEVSKQFEVSKENLYKAWTAPEQLKQWWKPMGKQLTEVKNNIVEGGEVLYIFEGNSLTIEGKYEKVAEPDLLEYTWNWHVTAQPVEDSSYKLSVRFEGDANSSTLTVTQKGFSDEKHVQPHKEGWEQGLQQLYDYLTNAGNTGSTDSPGGQQKPPISGYNETPEQLKVAGG